MWYSEMSQLKLFDIRFFKNIYFFFKGSIAKKEGGNQTCIHWFIPQMAAMARVEPHQSQEPRTVFWSPMWVAGI